MQGEGIGCAINADLPMSRPTDNRKENGSGLIPNGGIFLPDKLFVLGAPGGELRAEEVYGGCVAALMS